MDVTFTITFQTDDQGVVDSVSNILWNALPYMADNVDVAVETED